METIDTINKWYTRQRPFIF